MKLDGIKRGLLFVLPILFGVCFNSCFGYTQIDNCYTSTSNASRHGVCRIFDRDEEFKITSTTIEGATITFGAKFDTNGKPMFIVNNVFELNSKQRESNSILYYNQSGYYNYYQSLGYIGENDSYEIYSFNLNKLYCAIESGDSAMYQKCSQPPKGLGWTSTVDDINEYIGDAIMTGYRITFADRATIYTGNIYAICPMFDNGFEFCIPFDSSYNNSLSAQGTRTKLDGSRNSTDAVLTYLSNNYPIYNTPFTVNGGSSSNNGYFDSLTVMGGAEQIYNAYVLEGYERAMCYGGYPLIEIVDTTNGIDLSGFKSGTGASLNEIYEATSGGMSKVDRYNSNFAYFTYAYRSNDYNIFNGDPYALLGLMSIKQIIKPGASASSVIAFCDLVQNGVWSGSAIDLINESVENLQYQQLIGEIGVNVPSSGSAIDLMVKSLQDQGYLTGFSFKSVFSGTEEESITTIKSRWDELYEKISGGLSVASGFNGILPGYIAMGFLAFLLLYLFKK